MFSHSYNAIIGGASVYRFLCFLFLWLLSNTTVYGENGKVATAFPLRDITIDGDLSDWPQTATAQALDFAFWQEPSGPRDIGATLRLGYDAEANALYVAVEVIDDETVLATSEDNAQRDGCALYLAAADPSGRQRLYIITDDAALGRGWRERRVDPTHVQSAVVRAGPIQRYEWRIALAGVGAGKLVAKPGVVLAFNAAVQDVDTDDETRPTRLSWGDFARGRRGAAGLGDVLLVERPSALGHVRGLLQWSNPEGEEPPQRVHLQRDNASELTLATDTTGVYELALPAGTYQLTLADARAEHSASGTVQVKAGELVAAAPLVADKISPARYYRKTSTSGPHRGVNWVATSRPLSEYDFLPLAKNHVDWIAQTPFGWMSRYDEPAVRTRTGRRNSWSGESDQGIAETARLARKFGIATLLKPHIWLNRNTEGKWVGDIAMKDEVAWAAWWEDYRAFMLHYAHLAEAENIEMLCIGTELYRVAVEREAEWRQLIADIRAVYGGKLVYAANWYKEFEEVRFWDALDYIGLQAYFPLESEKNSSSWLPELGADTGAVPTVAQLKRAWTPHLELIERVQQQYGKELLVTEIGYRSAADAATKPWEWDSAPSTWSAQEELLLQANCYEAFFAAFWQRPLFAGSYIWKWYPDHARAGGPGDRDFTPQNKPAQEVMRRWYSPR